MVERQEATQEHVTFSAAGLDLEGVLHLPDGDGPFPAVAVCHPHPLYGGDMNNNVVLAICTALAGASVAALRFNMRGVGRSQGHYEDGIGEQDDVVAAVSFLESLGRVDPLRMGLAAYSFGTKVAMPAALRDHRVRAVALVSPFLARSEWEELESYEVPKLFICGTEDGFIPVSEVEQLAGRLAGHSQCEIIQGADHFWWGYEGEIAWRTRSFFRAVFDIPGDA